MTDAPAAQHPNTEQNRQATPIGTRPYDPISRDEIAADPAVPDSWPHTFEAPRAVAARAQIAAGCFDGHVDTCRQSCPDCIYRPCTHCPLCGACPCTWHPDCPPLPFASPAAGTVAARLPAWPLCWSCGTASDATDISGLCPNCSARRPARSHRR
jgi:hypothetical protein